MTLMQELDRRLVRGTRVIVADSVGHAHLRGVEQIIASKAFVKCNRGDRCAGDWCIGRAVFVMDPATKNDDRDMGWRNGTTKLCITHLKDMEGNLILPPSAMEVAQEALERQAVVTNTRVRSGAGDPVTWEELATTASERDWAHLVSLARRLKRENETLTQKVVDLQAKVIEQLTR